ncbi:uncharacterized protein [Ptychodera flava]
MDDTEKESVTGKRNVYLESIESTDEDQRDLEDTDSSGNALAAFDKLSKRAQDILENLYSPKRVDGSLKPKRVINTDCKPSVKEGTKNKEVLDDGRDIKSRIPLPSRKYVLDEMELGDPESGSRTSDASCCDNTTLKSTNAGSQDFVPILLTDKVSQRGNYKKEMLHQGKKKSMKSKSRTERQNSKSIQEILESRNGPLSEEELWALCRQGILTIGKSKGILPSYISLSSTLIHQNGSVSYRSISADTSLDSMYLAPELQDQGILNDKTCFFGVGAMLWSAADWRLSPTQQPEVSEALENLLINMTQDNADDRPDLDYIVKMCEEHEQETGIISDEVCKQLWKEGNCEHIKGTSQEDTMISFESTSPYFTPSTSAHDDDDDDDDDDDAKPNAVQGFKSLTHDLLESTDKNSPDVLPIEQQTVLNLELPERPSAFVNTGKKNQSDEETMSRPYVSSESSLSSIGSSGAFTRIEGASHTHKHTGDVPTQDNEAIVFNHGDNQLLVKKGNIMTDLDLPKAYSSEATHFTPIILHQDKRRTSLSSNHGKPTFLPQEDFKQKMAKAMKLELMKPKPPINIVQDLENEVLGKDGKEKSRKRDTSSKGSEKRRGRSRSESPRRHVKSSTKDSKTGRRYDQNRKHERSRKKRESETQKIKNEKVKMVDEINIDKQSDRKDTNIVEEGKTQSVTVIPDGCHANQVSEDSVSKVKGEVSGEEYEISENSMKSSDNENVQQQPDSVVTETSCTSAQNPLHIPNLQMQNLSNQPQVQLQSQKGSNTPIHLQQVSPSQMSNSPLQNIPTNSLLQIPGMYPNFPIQVALQQDPHTGLFNMVPIGLPYPGFTTVQSNTPIFSGVQNFQNLPFQTPVMGLQYNTAFGQYISSDQKIGNDNQRSTNLKAATENVKVNIDKLTPEVGETDSDSEYRKNIKRDKNEESPSMKRERIRHGKNPKTELQGFDSYRNNYSDSESSESSLYQRSVMLDSNDITNRHSCNNEYLHDQYGINSKTDDKLLNLHSQRVMVEDLDDTRPLDNMKVEITSPASPMSMSSLSRDSGVHMQANLSSAEEMVSINGSLADVLTNSANLKNVIKLIRETYAFDGYLENGVEDLAMAKYITSLAKLKWTTFSSAISEKFCDLYWEEEVLEKLFEAVNGHRPVKTPKRSRSPRPISRTRMVVESVADITPAAIASLTNEEGRLSFNSDDENNVIDDLLFGYETSVSPTPSTCSCTSAVMKSKVVADAKLFTHEKEKRTLEKSVVSRTLDQKIDVNHLKSSQSIEEENNVIEEDSLTDLIQRLSTENEDNVEYRTTASESGQSLSQTGTLNSDSDDTDKPSLEINDTNLKLLTQFDKFDDLNQSTMSLDSTSSGTRFIQVKSYDDAQHMQEVQSHRLRKSPLLNPATVRPRSSLSDTDSGSSSKRGNLRRALSKTLSRHNSSASSSASSSVSALEYQATSSEDNVSMQVSLTDNASELLVTRPKSSMFFDADGVDPLIVDYTGQLVQQGDMQQSIEAKLSEVEQQLMIECRMKAKSEKFYRKLMESQKGKGRSGVDQRNVIPKVSKQIEEMAKKVHFLESAKRHLEMLYAEQWGLDHKLLYSLASCTDTGNGLIQLEPSNENPLLAFHSSRDGNILQAGTSLGLFSYLFARQSLLEGYLHHFFYTYHYFATSKELFKFITSRFTGASSIAMEQKENRMKVHCRAMDIIQVWIEGFFEVDFRNDTALSQELVDFIKLKVIPVDPQGQHLLHILEKYQNMEEEGKALRMMMDDSSTTSHGDDSVLTRNDGEVEKTHKPKRISSFRTAIGLRKKSSVLSKKERSKVGVTACLSNTEVGKGASGVYFPSQSMQTDWFSISEHLTATLANQLTLMQQDLFKKAHPVHFMNSRAYGVGVESTVNPLFRRMSQSSKSPQSDNVELSTQLNRSSSLFVDDLHDGEVIQSLLDHSRNVSHWVSCEILCCSTVKAQIALLSKFIHLAKTCYELRNYDTCVQIIDGLDNLIIRQVPAWRNIPAKSNTAMQELTAAKMFLKSDSHCLVEGESHRDQPTLPCTLLSLMHVQQLEIGSYTLANGMYKWTKLRTIAKLVDQIRVFKEHSFNYEADPELQTLLHQRMMKFKGQDLHTLAAQQLSQFQLAGEKSSRKFHDALKRVKATLQ